MSGVSEVVREFLDRLERGEGSAEDRALADSLAWWASGWKARGASAPVGIVFPERLVPGEVVIPAASRNGDGPAEDLPEGPVPWSAGRGDSDVDVWPSRLKSALFAVFLADEPPAEVVASVDAPAKWNKPGTVSQPDLDFAEMLRRDYGGEWVEVRVEGMTKTQVYWLAQKITGSGKAYRPPGSFEARLVQQGNEVRLFALAVKQASDESVPVDPAPAWSSVEELVGSGQTISAEKLVAAPAARERTDSRGRPYKGMSEASRRAALKAPTTAVAVIDPPEPVVERAGRPFGEPWPQWSEFATAIRSYDGAWVEVEVSDRNQAGRGNLASAIRGMDTAFRPAGEFESTIQSGRLYARWRKGSKRAK